MVKAHEASGGWWETRQGSRSRVYTDERGAWIDIKAAEIVDRQEWRPVLEDGTPAPWPTHADATGDRSAADRGTNPD